MRLSVLVTLLRIVSSPAYIYSLYITMFIVVVIGLEGVVFLLIQCKPVSYYWDKSHLDGGHCFSELTISRNVIVTGCIAAYTDVFSAVLPILLLWNVQMNIRAKVLVCVMLSLGAL